MGIWDNLNEVPSKKVNPYIEDIEEGMQLIRQILSQPKAVSDLELAYKQFCQLLEEDYLAFAEKAGMPNEAGINQKIQAFRDQLFEYIQYPELYKKRIVAVGGSFSAGKSRIINQIVGEEVLPTDTTPTTSIPTYLLKGKYTTTQANNIFNSKQLIDDDAVKAISHAFSKKYNLSFGKALKHILLKSSKMPHQHLAILDTPGYSKSDKHLQESSTDEYKARMHLKKADFLVWVVDIQKGNIPDEDLKFIQSLEFEKPIFFVLNKADKKARHAITAITRLAKKTLEKEDLHFAGIAAVSAKLKKEYSRMHLSSFFKSINEPATSFPVLSMFQQIMDAYQKYYDNQIRIAKMDLLQLNKEAVYSHSNQEKQQLKHVITEKKKQISTCKNQMQDFQAFMRKVEKVLEKIERLLGQGDSQDQILEALISHKRETVLRHLHLQTISTPMEKLLKSEKRTFSINELAEEVELEEERLINVDDWINQDDAVSNEMAIALKQKTELSYTFSESETIYDIDEVLEVVEAGITDLCDQLVSKAIFTISDNCMNTSQFVQDLFLPKELEKQLLAFLMDINQTVVEEIEGLSFPDMLSGDVDQLLTELDWVTKETKPFVEHVVRHEIERIGQQVIEDIRNAYNHLLDNMMEDERSQME